MPGSNPPPPESKPTEDLPSAVVRKGSLRRRLTAWVVGGLLSATALTSASLYLTARQSLLHESSQDAEVLAVVLGMSGAMTQRFMLQAEQFITEDLASSATLLSEYVALAERSGQTPSQTMAILRKMLKQAPHTEIWVTDSQGKAYLHPNSDQPFFFSPDPKAQPQASAFWPLLTGGKKLVNQDLQPRALDGKLFKYLGVAGVDKPRIVQVGFDGEWVQSVAQQFGIERLSKTLIDSQVLRTMYLVEPALITLAYKGSGWSDPKKELQARSALMQQALDSGQVVQRVESTGIEVYQRVSGARGEVLGVLAASMSREAFDAALTRVLVISLSIGLLVSALGTALALRLTRRLTAPILAVTQTAEEVGRGDFSQLNRLHRAQQQTDEVGQLASVLETMAVDVRDREKVLETLVKERTQELKSKNSALEEAQAKIDQELALGQRLQLGSLPSRFPDLPACQGAARIIPALQMGGDFYDFISLPQGRVGLVMADVSGKGVAAAFFMAVTRTTLSELAPTIADPGECLRRVNDLICERNPLDMFVTVFYAVLDPQTGELTYANAGHNPPRRVLGQQVQALVHQEESSGMADIALGILPGTHYTTHRHNLEPGELLLLYTDGVTEAFDPSNEAYGEHRLDAVLARVGSLPPQEILESLLHDVTRHAAGAAQSDDITLTALKWQPQTHAR
jgi:phosphoserine phosphatase RsbU/P